jgi:FecR protein
MFDRISMLRSVTGFALGLALFGFSAAARADDAQANARAARLTFLQGTVTVESADNTGGQTAKLNLPLLAGVRVATGDDGQAEIEFEDGSLVRLTPNSALSLDTLSVEAGGDGGVFTTGLSLLHGLAYLELRATPQYRYTLDAGGDVLSPIENTTVRVNFDEPPAVFAVLDGVAQIARQGGTTGAGYQREVRAGESLRRDADDPGQYSLTSEVADDSWDGWNEDRDQAAASEAGNRTAVRDNYAGAQGYGWSDLDANGSWYDVPGQGPVWQPTVAAADTGFDPYGNGAWVYSGGAYLFASGYSWGWTPYRCGNWSYFGGFGWGWSPVAGCGGFGWGFVGGGRPVNIVFAPNGYRVPMVPRPHPGPVHPIMPTRVSTGWQMPLDAQNGYPRHERRIAGVTVMPVEPVGSGYAAHGDGRAGSALQRDYPVDRTTHMAIVGRPAAQPGVVHTESGWHSTGTQASRPVPVYHPATGTTPPVRIAPPPRQEQRPNTAGAPTQRSYPPPSAPVQRSSPPPAPVQHSAPPPPPPPHVAPSAGPVPSRSTAK